MDFNIFNSTSDYRCILIKTFLYENGHCMKEVCRILGGNRAERHVISLLSDAARMVDFCPTVWRRLVQLSRQLSEEISRTRIDESFPEVMELSELLRNFILSVEAGTSYE